MGGKAQAFPSNDLLGTKLGNHRCNRRSKRNITLQVLELGVEDLLSIPEALGSISSMDKKNLQVQVVRFLSLLGISTSLGTFTAMNSC
jgi:hypothetical protein